MCLVLMCNSPRAVLVTGKMLHIQVFGNVHFNELHEFLFLIKMHLSICLTYILSLSIIFFYIMYNPVIVAWTNYFVLWNDFHITV